MEKKQQHNQPRYLTPIYISCFALLLWFPSSVYNPLPRCNIEGRRHSVLERDYRTRVDLHILSLVIFGSSIRRGNLNSTSIPVSWDTSRGPSGG
ncbi:hypothetical protein L218DRAFT_375432 [Marasmius fiardii PR-910]|nr:hypothetical protein L218DRAFT_375432 [Marasmius fiardii PR-910]